MSGTRNEPSAIYRGRMDTNLWRYTHPRDGRVTTKNHFSEAEAHRNFPDAQRVEGSLLVAERGGHLGCGFASGLTRREDGAMVQDGGRQIEMPGS